MYSKALFLRLWHLLLHSREEWALVASESPRRDVLRAFVLPLTLLCGLAALLGCLMQGGLAAGVVIVEVCSVMVSLLLTFVIASSVANVLLERLLHVDGDRTSCQLLVGYSMAVCLVLMFVTELFPQLVLFRWILQFYIVYVFWEGAPAFFSLSDEDRMKFSVIASAVILLLPYLLEMLITSVARLFGL